jgi:hypothetical protein
VNGVALASVITPIVAVIATGGVAVWTARESANLVRETRVQQRLGCPGFKRVKLPEPAVTDQPTIAAHLAAFGSKNVRGLYQAWRDPPSG